MRPRLFESSDQIEGLFLGLIAGVIGGLLTCSAAGCGGAPSDCRTKENCRPGLTCQRHLHPGDSAPVYECLQPKPQGLTVEPGCPSGSCGDEEAP